MISVVIPVYNAEKYIRRCIHSIKNQTYANIEMIIVNDGSTDHTYEILEDLSKDDDRITIICQKNSGLSAARNKGLKKAMGDYISFIDGDDEVSPDFLEKGITNIKNNKSDISVCGFRTIYEDGREKSDISYNKTITGKNATIQLLTKQDNVDIIACNKIYKRTLFANNDIMYPEGELHEDALTTYKLYAKAKKVSYIRDALYYYHKHSNSITTSTERIKSLNYKLRAAREATRIFHKSKDLSNAAEVAELLAYFSLIDAMLKHEIPYKDQYFNWIKNNKKNLEKNRFLSKKLKIYMTMVDKKDSWPYKLYRTIWH